MGKHQLCGGWSGLGIAGCIRVPRLAKQKVQNGKRGCRELGKKSGQGDWYTVQQGAMAVRLKRVGPGCWAVKLEICITSKWGLVARFTQDVKSKAFPAISLLTPDNPS